MTRLRALAVAALGLCMIAGPGHSEDTVATPPLRPEADSVSSELGHIRRIHVEKLAGGETAEQIRAMIIATLQGTGLFVLTENPDRADAILRGTAEDLIFTETHDTRDGVTARGTMSVGSGSRSSSSSSGRGGFYTNSSVGENESSRTVERKHEASAAVRLVNPDGDIVWSTLQESHGAKFRGASADVAEKIARQLLKDFKRVRSAESAPDGGKR